MGQIIGFAVRSIYYVPNIDYGEMTLMIINTFDVLGGIFDKARSSDHHMNIGKEENMQSTTTNPAISF